MNRIDEKIDEINSKKDKKYKKFLDEVQNLKDKTAETLSSDLIKNIPLEDFLSKVDEENIENIDIKDVEKIPMPIELERANENLAVKESKKVSATNKKEKE